MSRRSSACQQWLTGEETWSQMLVTGFAEFIGSLILIFIGCMGCVGSLIGPAPLLQIALTFGFAIASIVHIIGHISHSNINPMVSVCHVILGIKSVVAAAVYIFAHFMGAIIGYGLLRIVTPAEFLHGGDNSTIKSFCTTAVNENILPIQGAVVEAVATGILIIFVCACADPRNSKSTDSTAIKFGLLIAMLAMACAPYTGCSLNPARSFAPALWNNVWKDHWVYWLGPISGTVMVSFVYKIVFWPKKSMKEEIAEAVALTAINTEKSEMK